MQIRDVSTNSLGQIISITLKSTGKPTEKRTSVALTLWQLSDISFIGVFIIVVILAVMFDIFVAHSLAGSVIAPMENLSLIHI